MTAKYSELISIEVGVICRHCGEILPFKVETSKELSLYPEQTWKVVCRVCSTPNLAGLFIKQDECKRQAVKYDH